MRLRICARVLALASLLVLTACGGTPRAATADLVTIRQPTPDPTLDAVVRDLPRALAGVVAPPPTPTPTVPAPPQLQQKPKSPLATPTVRPVQRAAQPTASPSPSKRP